MTFYDYASWHTRWQARRPSAGPAGWLGAISQMSVA